MSITSAKKRVRAGRIISALPVLFLLVDALAKLLLLDPVVEACAHIGWPAHAIVPLGVLEGAVAILFALPRTAVLGAVLSTGLLGGAVAVHVMSGTPFWFPIVFGALIWLGMLLRDDRLRVLLPVRYPRAL